nr:hypothetical protein [Mycobacterium sp. E3298]
MSGDKWIHQVKWDGFRILIHYDNGSVRTWTREGNEVTDRFPELQRIRLNCKTAILDGECICFYEGKPSWEDSITRLLTKNAAKVNTLTKTMPAHFVVWDIILCDGGDLTSSSLLDRLGILQDIVTPSDALSATSMSKDGLGLFENVQSLGLEGIVSKNISNTVKSRYYIDSRPQNVWVKTKNYQYDTFQITGIRKKEFGWSLSSDGEYRGVIEFPPSSEARKAFFRIAKQIKTGENRDWIFLDPVISCKVKYQSLTRSGKLRSPTFQEFIL